TDVALGLMSRWGTEDPTDGGNASRYSLSVRWSETNKTDWSRVEAFFIHNDTNLYDDFTYQLANPITGLLPGVGGTGLGDQTHQFDQRQQYDFITDNWLKESYLSPWTDTTQFWSPWLRTTEGLRLDWVFGSVNNVM